MPKFFNIYYYIDLKPLISSLSLKLFLALFVALVIAGIAIKIYHKLKKFTHAQDKLLDRYFSIFVVMGFLGILYTLFRYEEVYLLSARLWLVVWVVVFIIWLAYIIRYQIKVVPQSLKQLEQKQQFLKYLPKKKK